MIQRLINLFRNERIYDADDKTILRIVRNGHIRGIVFVLGTFLLLFLFTYRYGFAPAHEVGDWSLSSWELLFVCIGIILVFLGIFWFQLTRFEKHKNKTATDLWSIEFIRLAMIFSAPVCGYILRITGSGWHIISALFLLSIFALAVTFPTINKIKKLGINQKISN
jgi:hypothetical protein